MAKILVVEDDKDIRKNLGRLLISEGHTVELAGNGQEALEALQKNEVMPALIILDLMMPVMDGFKFREEQMKDPKFAGIPVLVMTADGHVEEKKSRIGTILAIKKPADVDEILNAVNQICGK